MQNNGKAPLHWLDKLKEKADKLSEKRVEAVHKRLAEELPDCYPVSGYRKDSYTPEEAAKLWACLLELDPTERVVMDSTEAGFIASGLKPGQVTGLDKFTGKAGAEFYQWARGQGFRLDCNVWHGGWLNG